MRTVFKCMASAGVVLFCFMGEAFAQPGFDPWLADGLNRQIQNNKNSGAAPQNTGPSASEVRAWHARERKIQAEIAQHKATPYWMAIVNDFTNNRMMWGGGFYTEQRAIEEALKGCRSSNCQVIKTLSNACAVVVGATGRPKTVEDFFIGVNKDDKVAAAQAMQACEAVHGKNRQDRCFYSTAKTKNGTAFCAGYDYSVYGHR